MILLLDTNALIRWFVNDGSLRPEADGAIRSPMNEVIVSAATIWEVELKRANGRLTAPDNILERIATSGFASIGIDAADAVAAARLPRHHADPFDRMLIAQAQRIGAVVVTRDAAFVDYDVDVLPA
ncbi:MAG: type II toxin-antitoxin system VapC family toxin [Chloroflexota bacterium]